MHPVCRLWREEQAAEQVWSEHRGQVYLTRCAVELEGQNVQSFAVEVEGTEAAFAHSSVLSGGFMAVGLDGKR